RDQGVPWPDGGATRGGIRARAAPSRAPLARGPRPGRAVEPCAPQQVPAPAHRGPQGGRRRGPGIWAARGPAPALRSVTTTVLVTGGAGYIGSVVVDQVIAR